MEINKPPLQVIVIGSAGIDTNVYLYGDEIDFSVEANFTENIDYVGQAGGYYAKAFSRLGLRTGYIGFIGEDPLGKFIVNDFHKNSIDTTHVGIDAMGTKRSINIMYKDGQRKNFYDGKGHMNLSLPFKQIQSYIQQATLVHFNLMNWSRHLLQPIKDLGITISCDLQDIVDIQDPYRKEFIQSADFLFLSCVNFPDPKPLLHQIFSLNPTTQVVIGRGKKGCIYANREKLVEFNSVDLENWPVIDTNGAGDSLGAGFLSSLLFHDYSIEEAIMRGQIYARYTCGLKASSDLLKLQELDHFYQKIQKRKDFSV